MTPCTQWCNDSTWTPTAPRPYVGLEGPSPNETRTSDVPCHPVGTPEPAPNRRELRRFDVASNAASTFTLGTRAAAHRTGKGTTTYDPGRLPSCRVLPVSEQVRVSSRSLFGLRVTPAHLFACPPPPVASAIDAVLDDASSSRFQARTGCVRPTSATLITLTTCTRAFRVPLVRRADESACGHSGIGRFTPPTHDPK